VGAAVLVVDVVRVREDLLAVAAVPLHRDLDLDGDAPAVRLLGREVEDLVVDRLLRLVQELDAESVSASSSRYCNIRDTGSAGKGRVSTSHACTVETPIGKSFPKLK
jgi:hypothetical protein